MKNGRYLGKILVGALCFALMRALMGGDFVTDLGSGSEPVTAQRGIILLLIVVAILMIVATINIFKK